MAVLKVLVSTSPLNIIKIMNNLHYTVKCIKI